MNLDGGGSGGAAMKELDVISVSMVLRVPPLVFFAGRATAMNRDTRLGGSATATLRTKRDASRPA